jgi:hypothetical protein
VQFAALAPQAIDVEHGLEPGDAQPVVFVAQNLECGRVLRAALARFGVWSRRASIVVSWILAAVRQTDRTRALIDFEEL